MKCLEDVVLVRSDRVPEGRLITTRMKLETRHQCAWPYFGRPYGTGAFPNAYPGTSYLATIIKSLWEKTAGLNPGVPLGQSSKLSRGPRSKQPQIDTNLVT
jgi:hypothetical protein